MSDDGLNEEARALIQGYLEGNLTPAQSRRLLQLIRQDPRLARLVSEGLRMDDAIRELAPNAVRHRRPRRYSRYRPSDRPSTAWVVTAALAATFVVAFLGFALQDPKRSAKEDIIVRVLPPVPSSRWNPPGQQPERVPPGPTPIPKNSSGFTPREPKPPAELDKRTLESIPPMETPSEPTRPPSNSPSPLAPTVVESIEIAQVKGMGDASIVVGKTRTPLAVSRSLHPGEGLETGASGRATLIFRDGTRVELDAETMISKIRVEKGKYISIDQGSLRADVAPQPSKEPMVFATPQGNATVLGTSLGIAVDPTPNGTTLLQVSKGRVQFRKAIVNAGGHAIASRSNTSVWESRPPSALNLLEDRRVVTISFGPGGRVLPVGSVIDEGKVFDEARGYGWKEAVPGFNESPGTYPNPLEASFISGGDRVKTLTWKMKVPKGKYEVTVCVGGVGNGWDEQGPHQVTVEGKPVVNAEMTKYGKFLRKTSLVEVRDGELNVAIGGHRTDKMASDNNDDTVMNYLIVRRK